MSQMGKPISHLLANYCRVSSGFFEIKSQKFNFYRPYLTGKNYNIKKIIQKIRFHAFLEMLNKYIEMVYPKCYRVHVFFKRQILGQLLT